MAAGPWLEAPNEKAGAAGAVDLELPNAVEGPAVVDVLLKPPVFDPDPKPLDELEPKAVDVEPKPDELAGV